jgi:hypothetical protein
MGLKKKKKALFNIKKLLNKRGMFVLCDPIILFDPEKDKELFNSVYRYLIAETTPTKIYEKYIKPYFEDDNYIYSWDDMKKYTPQKNWYYSIKDLETMLNETDMKIDQVEKICPFFGILCITNN